MDKLLNQVKDFSIAVIDHIYKVNEVNSHYDTPTLKVLSIDSKVDDKYYVIFMVRGSHSLYERLFASNVSLSKLQNELKDIYKLYKDPLMYTRNIYINIDGESDDIYIEYEITDYTEVSQIERNNHNRTNLKTIKLSDVPSEAVMTTNRGVEYKVYKPHVGTIVGMRDSGYGSGLEIPYVVTKVNTKKEKGNIVPTSAYIYQIIKIDDNIITHDSINGKQIKIYYQKGYEFWNDSPSHNLHNYYLDEYVVYNSGYMK